MHSLLLRFEGKQSETEQRIMVTTEIPTVKNGCHLFLSLGPLLAGILQKFGRI